MLLKFWVKESWLYYFSAQDEKCILVRKNSVLEITTWTREVYGGCAHRLLASQNIGTPAVPFAVNHKYCVQSSVNQKGSEYGTETMQGNSRNRTQGKD